MIRLDKNIIDEVLFKFHADLYRFEKLSAIKFNITWDELYLIHLIQKDPELRMTDLSKKLLVKKFQMTRSIRRLSNNGFLSKKPNFKDTRVHKLELTQKAFDIIREIEKYHFDLLSKSLADVDVGKLLVLVDFIRNIDKLLLLEKEAIK